MSWWLSFPVNILYLEENSSPLKAVCPSNAPDASKCHYCICRIKRSSERCVWSQIDKDWKRLKPSRSQCHAVFCDWISPHPLHMARGLAGAFDSICLSSESLGNLSDLRQHWAPPWNQTQAQSHPTSPQCLQIGGIFPVNGSLYIVDTLAGLPKQW
jgi:hypothetical protein